MRMLASKIQGSLLGSLLGDCLGAPFENDAGPIMFSLYRNYFEGLKKEDSVKKLPIKSYTDDAAMTMMVAESLVEKKGFDARDMATRFADEYFRQPRRGYGGAVVDVFRKLRRLSDSDSPFDPAAQQFGGSGSYGNGGGMRVAPVALYFRRRGDVEVNGETNGNGDPSADEMRRVAVEQAKLTHSNPLGYNGALLQCLAVAEALKLAPDAVVGAEEFCGKLLEEMRPAEDAAMNRTPNGDKKSDEGVANAKDDPVSRPYCAKLNRIKQLATKSLESGEINREIVIRDLGNDVTAIDSVPTAVFCYLMAQGNKFDSFKADSLVERAVQLAISLGGDTDTVASMAGAIAGAHAGVEDIPESLLRHCEARDKIMQYAEQILKS